MFASVRCYFVHRAPTEQEIPVTMAEVRKILSDPPFQEKFMAPQLFESMAATPEEFSSYIKAETATWAKVRVCRSRSRLSIFRTR